MSGGAWYGLTTLLRRLPDRRGIAAFEFALTAPILISCVLAVVDLSNAILTWRRLTIAAESIAEIATEEAAQPAGNNLITQTQAWNAMTAAFAVLPTWQSQIGASTPNYAITLSSIVYTPTVAGCTTNCSYIANVAWSYPFTPGTIETRPCGIQQQVPNNQANSLTVLPVGIASASPILVADVATTFEPLFFAFITGPIQMLESAYLPPRIGTTSQYVVLAPPGTSCAGY
jgi:Flp pilus assembly protein TadG